jgi:hypothetical protein
MREDDKLLTYKQVAELLGCSVQLVRNMYNESTSDFNPDVYDICSRSYTEYPDRDTGETRRYTHDTPILRFSKQSILAWLEKRKV